MNSLLRPRTWIPVLGLAAGLLGIAAPASAATVVTINDPVVAEGDPGDPAVNLVWTITAVTDAGGTGGGTIHVETANGTAQSQLVAGGFDYVFNQTDFVVAPSAGAKVEQFPLSAIVVPDTTFEPDETVFANITITAGAIGVGDAQGVGTITNDDVEPTITISDATNANEGNAAQLPRQFAVTLSNASFQQITVDFATIDQTASAAAANADYVAANGTVTFAPFETEKVINVLVNGDTLFELNETFLVQLTNASATADSIVDSQGTTTIINDDAAPSFSINDVAQCEEDGSITFTVTLSAPSGVDTTVDFATANITTSAGDFTPTNGTLSFPKGTVTRTITVFIADDGTLEPNETFSVSLSNVLPAGAATIADGVGLGNIQDNDGVNNIVLENITTDGTVIDGAGGPVQRFRATAFNGCGDPVPGAPLTFTVVGSTGSNQTVTIVTDEDGEAIFEYTPLFPGNDTITVSDETLGAIALDQSTNVAITVAPNTVFGSAAGSGNVDAVGSIAFFSFDVNTNRNGKAKGSVQATVPNLVTNLRSTKILSLVIGEPTSGGRAAVIFGVGKAKGIPGTFLFRVDALDNGTPGVPNDRFVVTVINGGTTASAGGALKFQRPGIKNDIRVRTP